MTTQSLATDGQECTSLIRTSAPGRSPLVVADKHPAGVAERAGVGARRRLGGARGHLAWWVVPAGLALLVAAALISAASVDGDSGSDLFGLCRAIGADMLRLRWQYVGLVAGLAGLHYAATAVAARAASGVRLAFGEVLLVQLAASAANRLTPAGLGGSAVTARYYTRRGLDGPSVVGSVAALSVFGALADLGVLASLVLVGHWLGINGGNHELAVLTGKVAGLVAQLRTPWLWLAVGVALLAAVGRRRRRRAGERPHRATVWRPVGRLARRPSALGVLMAASGSTTLILGFAFVASTAMVPGPQPNAGLGALLVAFMLGSASGSAVPVPAGLGSTEAALIGALATVDVPVANAVQVVLIFRLLTFWLPAVVGILATRRLRRRAAL